MLKTFIVWIVFIRIEQDKLKKHENVYENNDYCYIEMPEEGIEY